MAERPDIEVFLALAAKATPGQWESDTTKSEGSYGVGDDTHEGFMAYEIIVDVRGKPVTLCDSLNSDAGEIEEEFSGDENGDYHSAWDEVARKNFEFIAAAKNDGPAIAQYALSTEARLSALTAENERLFAALRVMVAAYDAQITKDALSYIGLGHDAHFPCMPAPINSTEAARAVCEEFRARFLSEQQGGK